mmetsp:Transcript_76550/g.127611  ORF Transcript_76550/g.127611 Transcript_76550/m.127611 type:complete len:376 (-) Transcript_76550:30-1157(-)
MTTDWPYLTDRLRTDASFTTLICVASSFSLIPSEALQALSHSATVHTVHFQLMEMTDDDCGLLERFGLPVRTLRTLKVSRNRISAAGLSAIAKAALLPPASSLTNLDLSANPLGRYLAPLGSAVAQSQLRVLNLSSTQCAEGLTEMAHALRDAGSDRPCMLQTLFVQNNAIGDDVAAQLVAPLAAAGVCELFLGKNAIGDAGGMALAQGCAEVDGRGMLMSPLRKLSLINNSLGDAAASAFARALGASCPLLALNLSHNRIGDAGVNALATSVQQNARIAALDVSINAASKHATSALAALMTREAQSRRGHAQFQQAARHVLLANRFPHGGEGEVLLAKLPHILLLAILEFAKPGGFDMAHLTRAQGEPAPVLVS